MSDDKSNTENKQDPTIKLAFIKNAKKKIRKDSLKLDSKNSPSEILKVKMKKIGFEKNHNLN